jgi:hypothetical protein
MDDRAKLVALQRHWDASDAGDFEVERESTARTPCLIIRNRANASAAD